ADYAEAQLVVRVAVTEIFRNCPRYVHRYRKIAESEYVPHPGSHAPLAAWKKVDDVQAALSKADRERVAREGGLITRAEYEKYLAHVADSDGTGSVGNALFSAAPPWQARPAAIVEEFFMPGSRPSTADKRKTFHKLHKAGCFVIPNPWNG